MKKVKVSPQGNRITIPKRIKHTSEWQLFIDPKNVAKSIRKSLQVHQIYL